MFTGAADAKLIADTTKLAAKSKGCDHYSRSYLADFVRIEYRQLDESITAKLSTNLFEGYSVDQCADLCANELQGCTAFQFCLNLKAATSGVRKQLQSCTLISGLAKDSSLEDSKVILDKESGELVGQSKLLKPSDDCHVFSLRKDSQEAQLRDLLLNPMTTADVETARRVSIKNLSGLSFAGTLFLFSCLALVSTGLVCGLLIAKDNNELVRKNFDKAKILLRM